MFTGFGVRPQQAKIGFVYTKTLLATDLRPSKSQPIAEFFDGRTVVLLFLSPTMLLRATIVGSM
jgi:hypothetical protein